MKSTFKINAIVPAQAFNPNAGIFDHALKVDMEITAEYTETEYLCVLAASERFLNRFLAVVEARCGIVPIVEVESVDSTSTEE